MSTQEGMMVSELQKRIRQAALEGTELEDIERTIIDAAPLPEEEKSALWLYAHARLERPLGEREPALIAG
jgi:hypothetical protein